MVFEDRRKPTTTQKWLMVSLALNLFVIGLVAGTFVARGTNAWPFGFGGPERPPFGGPPPRHMGMLDDLRSRLSPEGQKVFDQEMGPFIAANHEQERDEIFRQLGRILLKEHPGEQEIRDAFGAMSEEAGSTVESLSEHLANMAMRLSPEDRYQLAISAPRHPPGKPRPEDFSNSDNPGQ